MWSPARSAPWRSRRATWHRGADLGDDWRQIGGAVPNLPDAHGAADLAAVVADGAQATRSPPSFLPRAFAAARAALVRNGGEDVNRQPFRLACGEHARRCPSVLSDIRQNPGNSRSRYPLANCALDARDCQHPVCRRKNLSDPLHEHARCFRHAFRRWSLGGVPSASGAAVEAAPAAGGVPSPSRPTASVSRRESLRPPFPGGFFLLRAAVALSRLRELQ